MKTRACLILFIVCVSSFFAFRQTAQNEPARKIQRNFTGLKPQATTAVAFGESGKVSDIAPAAQRFSIFNKGVRAFSDQENRSEEKLNFLHDADANLAAFSAAPMPQATLSFDGISNKDNNDVYGFAAVPPDTNGDVGPNHFVQSVNILTRVYDKNGNALTAPFKLSDVFAPLGTPCATRNDGSPTVLYDALADRWILSQFCTIEPPFRQMIAVSKTDDPAGAYFVYEFVMPNFKLNDYSKFGVWSDAYYMSTDEFVGSDFAGNGVFAFDKKKMLAGDRTASFVYFDLPSASTVRRGGFLPSDFDGLNAPPQNAPNIFLTYTANEYGNQTDALRLFDFRADFANPSNSAFTERSESPLPVAAFDPTSPDGRGDIQQPAPGDALDSQSDRLMYRAAYRNLGAAGESIVVNQTVRVSPASEIYRAGVRVYELRKSNGVFNVREQSTIGTIDASRWIGSAAQDYRGNLAVEYNSASETESPSIKYTGRLASEPAGTFRQENFLVKGTGVQGGFGSRWGGYSQMTVDPSDDCTFWLTNEYYSHESQAIDPLNWTTRIGKFKFDECANAPRSIIEGAVTNAATNQPIAGATITANAVYTRTSDANGSFGNLTLVPNTYTLTATASGFQTQNITVTIADGQTLTQNFALQPTAILSASGYKIQSESCAINGAIEPGETATLSLALGNTGAKNTTNLIAALLPAGGVINPSAAQNYGAVSTNGVNVTRSFTFTASPNLNCGDAIVLTFQLSDGAEILGTISITLNTGIQRFALRENFDSVVAPNLPNGWTTAATGAQQIWKTSNAAFQSAPNAAYSSAANQVGVNELVSPAFQINSANAELTFRNRYDLETTFLRNKLYDGAVLEIKIGDDNFQDVIAAGGAFSSGGYDGVIESCCQNPLGGKAGWSGRSGINQTPEFIQTKVKLPASAAGREVQLRWRVGTDNGTSREGQFVDDVAVSDGFACACQIAQTTRAPFDFDGDGKTDLSVFRPSDEPSAADFYVQTSRDNAITGANWGTIGDAAVNADFDGDGKTDYAVFRPSNRTWFVLRSSNNSYFAVEFGLVSDERVPADFDGDGQTDIAVFRRTEGIWYIRQSSDAQIRAVRFGQNGDLPVQADFDGDNRADIAVFRPSNGFWYIRKSSDGALTGIQFGQAGDKPIAGDFDADKRADFVVFRPSNGVWYQMKSASGFAAVQFGQNGDLPLQADFDGDGKLDTAIYRQSTGIWFYLNSSNAQFVFRRFGASGDVPLPTIFVP